jgi:hypothetical protein
MVTASEIDQKFLEMHEECLRDIHRNPELFTKELERSSLFGCESHHDMFCQVKVFENMGFVLDRKSGCWILLINKDHKISW